VVPTHLVDNSEVVVDKRHVPAFAQHLKEGLLGRIESPSLLRFHALRE
jgi:hypothetical protein